MPKEPYLHPKPFHGTKRNTKALSLSITCALVCVNMLALTHGGRADQTRSNSSLTEYRVPPPERWVGQRAALMQHSRLCPAQRPLGHAFTPRLYRGQPSYPGPASLHPLTPSYALGGRNPNPPCFALQQDFPSLPQIWQTRSPTWRPLVCYRNASHSFSVTLTLLTTLLPEISH